ncbi:glycoside hydrolase family 32 protein [Bifidobacterium mongoliense]|uniref:Sucrose-6-phosphate hydrolase n=1 Tax=Bifidobacterium mongoliense DSM 21395 TaxID=1437603 RepID=A0A087BVK0_9BIFI|nr:glycoside hydrolase family 32 protein [Bifidobacterium mongoliense]KFI75050.1 sucrose-6-phosphate hydrolase [Bifidobacterium mongoliense DSM 21395]
MSLQLMQQSVQNAQRHIDAQAPAVSKSAMRQRYHFMAQCGWINDPNGLIYFRGQYHFFYQYNPYGSFWSEMYWGHAVSDDLLHWKYLPVALAPSESYDDHPQGGCFSGSAIEKDGRLYVIYTGTANHGNGFEQTQNVAWSDDGITFTKYEGNPVLEAPEVVPHDFFRDPKVWEHNGEYYLVCGAQKDGKAQALLYCSKDLLHWEFFNTLFESRGEWGYMWECPDFFKVKDKWVFLCSPMGAGERTTVYFVGDFDYETGTFTYTVTGEADWGFDFYAPQTFEDCNGRRLMVGWANCWDWMPFWKDWGPTCKEGWCGSFALPREVTLAEDNTLRFTPIKEVQSLRTSPRKEAEISIAQGDFRSFPVGDGVAFELKFDIDLRASNADTFTVVLRKGAEEHTDCTIDLRRAEVRIDRNHADHWSRGISRSALRLKNKEHIDVDIFSDQSSLEVFVDGGSVVHSLNVFASSSDNGLGFQCNGGNVQLNDIEGYGLNM